jgi:hypothetical protein
MGGSGAADDPHCSAPQTGIPARCDFNMIKLSYITADDEGAIRKLAHPATW